MPELLTAQHISSLQPKASRYIVSDTKVSGLAVIVYPSGTKSFIYRYRTPKCRTIKSVPLGQTTKLSVKAARVAAKNITGDLSKNIDPQQLRKKQAAQEKLKKSNTDLQLFNYIEKYYTPYAKANSVCAEEIIQTLKREFESLKNKPIVDISDKDIDKWRRSRKSTITFARIKRVFTYLKACINTAVKHYKLIEKYSLQNHTLKRRFDEKVNPPKIRYLTKDEEQKLLDALEQRDHMLRQKRANYVAWQAKRNHHKKKQALFNDCDFPDHVTPIILLAYHTGFDIGDIFDLHWENIDFDNSQIRKIRNKTKHKMDNPQPVVVPMSPTVKMTLEQWKKQIGMTGRVFKSPVTGGRLDNISTAWKAIVKSAELSNFRIKDLRHTFGSWLAIYGVDILQIRDLMGHTNIKTTQVYAHLCPTKKEQSITAVFS